MVDVVDLALGRVSVPGSGDVSFNEPLRRSDKVSELRTKYDHPLVQLSSVNIKYDSWRSLARERGTEIIDLGASLGTFKEDLKLLEGQIPEIQKGKEAVALERDKFNTKTCRLQALLSRYRDSCNHVATRINDVYVGF